MGWERRSRDPRFLKNYLCPGSELNQRHADFQSAALPTELPGRGPENLLAPDGDGKTSGRARSANRVSVYDSGQLTDGSSYLAMELLEGRPLGDILEHEGQIAPGRALHILAHVLRGLGHIHSAGLIHRDIKPENIFLIRQGQDED